MSRQLISFDTEFTGKVPSVHSMLQLGACLIPETSKDPIDPQHKFVASLDPLIGSKWDLDTYRWWQNPDRREQYRTMRMDAVTPLHAMQQFSEWLKQFPEPTFVAFPSHIDWPFLQYYWNEFVGPEMPSGHREIIDGKTLAYALLWHRNPAEALTMSHLNIATLRTLAPQWFRDDLPHTHNALDDALEQAYVFRHMTEEMRRWH